MCVFICVHLCECDLTPVHILPEGETSDTHGIAGESPVTVRVQQHQQKQQISPPKSLQVVPFMHMSIISTVSSLSQVSTAFLKNQQSQKKLLTQNNGTIVPNFFAILGFITHIDKKASLKEL